MPTYRDLQVAVGPRDGTSTIPFLEQLVEQLQLVPPLQAQFFGDTDLDSLALRQALFEKLANFGTKRSEPPIPLGSLITDFPGGLGHTTNPRPPHNWIDAKFTALLFETTYSGEELAVGATYAS